MEQIEAVRPDHIQFDAENQIVVAPPGWTIQDIAELLPLPARIQQEVTLLTLDSFVDYVAAFKQGNSVIFANEVAASYEAILDYHTAPVDPNVVPRGPCDHIASYDCPQSDPWILWTAHSGKAMSQVEFARFLEDNLPDIASPPAAEFLQLVLKLQMHKAASFVSDIRLDNGQTQLRYEETIRNDTKRGELSLPDAFGLGISVFVDGPRYAVKCRLRYRLDESKLRMWYELERPADVFRAAVKEVSDTVRKKLPGVPFWAGKRG